jgi:hypothetical protein
MVESHHYLQIYLDYGACEVGVVLEIFVSLGQMIFPEVE